ncbi:hypothetical protein LROSL1_2315 [Furfurilactobacillus rossiae]|nr:hypothetical protein LROSL1_2315 [Furfurilactobacillus rossiae]
MAESKNKELTEFVKGIDAKPAHVIMGSVYEGWNHG